MNINPVDEIYFIVMRHFINDEEKYKAWLNQKHSHLNDKTPQQLLDQGREKELLEFLQKCLGRIR